ncbi:MAG: hypothetical protein NZM25_04255 [Leptospiraceae bacterium]|nr:hypothetical protein [Leptospiraceae bacterium]MDW8305774.1 hypothetical protein [Leptospiraceae bacterium]
MKSASPQESILVTKKFLLILLFFFVSCKKTTEEKTLTLQYPNTLASLPLKMLVVQKHDGFSLKGEAFEDHALAVASLLRGELDLLFTGTSLGAMQADKGVRLFRTLVWGTASVVLAPKYQNAKIPTKEPWNFLKGKKISLPFEKSPNDLQLKRIEEKAQLKLQREYHPHVQAVSLLLADKLDGAVLPEPLASQLVLEKKLPRLGELAQWEEFLVGELAPSPMVSLFVSPTINDYKQRLLKELEAKIQENIRMIHEKKEEALQVAQDNTSPQIAKEALRFTRFAILSKEDEWKKTRAFLEGAKIKIGDSFFLP